MDVMSVAFEASFLSTYHPEHVIHYGNGYAISTFTIAPGAFKREKEGVGLRARWAVWRLN